MSASNDPAAPEAVLLARALLAAEETKEALSAFIAYLQENDRTRQQFSGAELMVVGFAVDGISKARSSLGSVFQFTQPDLRTLDQVIGLTHEGAVIRAHLVAASGTAPDDTSEVE